MVRDLFTMSAEMLVKDISDDWLVPTATRHKFRQLKGLDAFGAEVVIVLLLAGAYVTGQFTQNRLLNIVFLVLTVFVFVSGHCHIWRLFTWWKCKRLLRHAQAGQESCAIFYGLPGGVFSDRRLCWDVGLIRADQGIEFSGEKHAFVLAPHQISSTAIRVLPGTTQELLKVDWKTPVGLLSSIYIWDPGANLNPTDSYQWLLKAATGEREAGGSPVDCTEFLRMPKSRDRRALWIFGSLVFLAMASQSLMSDQRVADKVVGLLPILFCSYLYGQRCQKLAHRNRDVAPTDEATG